MLLCNKFILLIGCVLLMVFSSQRIGFMEILSLLTAFSYSCIFSYLNPEYTSSGEYNKKRIVLILILSYLILCIIRPEFIVYLPLLTFDICIHIKNWRLYTLAFFIILFQHTKKEFWFTGVLFFLIGLSILLHLLLSKILVLNTTLHYIQDSSAEDQRNLRLRNKDLMEKQDYEIHVATLNERNRIAREIHDNVGHMLSRSILQVGAVLAINSDSRLDIPLHSLKDTLSQAMNSIRSSVHDLYDDSIDLKSAIESILVDFNNYEVTLDYDMTKTAPRNVKYCLISIVKEALSNIIKHSNATKFQIILREHPSFYQLLVEDNGTNIQRKEDGIGLENMKERVQVFHGNFTIHTEKGFKIFISIPKEDSHESSCS